jgi:putative alpha-1,2-mannosidase
VFLEGERLTTPCIQHERLVEGGTLRFDMGDMPNPDVFD